MATLSEKNREIVNAHQRDRWEKAAKGSTSWQTDESFALSIQEQTVRECVEIAKNMPICGLGKAGADRVADALLSHFHLEK